jgi:copper transport protein
MTVVEDVLRAASLAGLVLLAGVGAYWLYLWPAGRWSRPVTQAAWIGWTCVAATTIGLLGIELAHDGPPLRAVATAGGTSLVLRLALLALAWPWLREVDRTYGGSRYRSMSTAKSFAGGAVLVLLPLTYVVSGGWRTGPWAAGKAVLVALHIDAMTVWLGGLVVLAAVVLPRNDRQERDDRNDIRAALPRFRRVAIVCVAIIVGSLALHAIAQADGVSALLHSRHGALAAAKLMAAVALLWLGDRTLHRADGGLYPSAVDAGRHPIAARSELAVVALIVLLSAALVVVPT